MAGGRFDKLVGKVRPGTYINFESGRENAVISNGTRGTVIVPLPKATYGPAKQFIKLTSASPDATAATFGYSIYDDDPNRQMLLIREAFKRATTVYVYILTEGKKATADITMTLAAPETDDFNDAVMEEVKKTLGKKPELTGCNLSYDRRDKSFTVTLTGELTSVKNTGIIDTLTALKAASYELTADGEALSDLASVTKTGFYKKAQAMKPGDPDISVKVVVSKEGKQQEYTVRVSYPSSAPSAITGLTDTTAVDNTLTATAKNGGSRGNALTVTLDANPLGGYDVIIHLDGSKVTEYEGLHTVKELIALDNPYISFTGTGDLGEAAGTNLAGGTDEEAANTDITDFIDAWESVKFNTVCFPFNGEGAQNVKQAALTKIKYMRDNMGKGVQVVMPDAPGMDYEGVINVTNSVSLNGDALSRRRPARG